MMKSRLIRRITGGRLVPGAVVFSLLGYAGQTAYHAVDNWQMEHADMPSKPIVQRLAESKWIPLKSLSDEDYRGVLNEKVLGIEAEISIIDERIHELEKAKAEKPRN